MNPIYERLFDGYAADLLKEADNYNESAIRALLEQYPLDRDTRRNLEEAFFDRYLQWSTDAFALGLHLGLSLLHDQIRRIGPQQVQ